MNANNSPAGRIEQWYPITGRQPVHAGRATARSGAHIATHTPFPNTTRATESLDNGAGISWSFSVAAGASRDVRALHDVLADRQRRAAAAPAPAAAAAAGGRAAGRRLRTNGLLDATPRNKCVSKRYFRIRLRKKFRPIIAAVTIKMPKTTRVLSGPPWGTIVDLRGLPRGRFAVKITALTTTGRTIKGTRHYRTCRGKLKGGKPPL